MEFLGSYPILQFFGGLAIVTTAVLAFVAGDRIRRQRKVSPDDDIRDVIEELHTSMETTSKKLREDVAGQLSENRRAMYERTEYLERVINEFMTRMTERVHQIELTMAERLPRQRGDNHGEKR